MDVILSKIKSARKRLILGRALWSLQVCLLIGGCLALLLQLYALFVPFFYVNIACVAVGAASLLAAVVLTLVKLPGMTEAAKAVDGKALDSRILTAYELRDRDDIMTVMQRKDAAKYAERFNVKSIKIKLRIVPAILMVAVLLFTAICVPAKTQAKEKAETGHELQKLKEIVISNIRDMAAEVLETYPDNEPLRADVEKLVKDTVTTVRKAATEQAVNKAEERFKVKLQELVDIHTLTEEEKQLQEDIKEALKEIREEANEAKEDLPEDFQKQLEEALKNAEEAVKNAENQDEINEAVNDFKEKLDQIKDSSSGENPGGENPGGENPGGENPGSENPGGENPGGENPGGENPGGENPGGENPGGENPGGENPGGENPGGENPGGENPGGENPGGENPGGENPGGENPGGENPGGENPGGENPGGENPGGENPGGENPGGENPGGENPGGQGGSGQGGSGQGGSGQGGSGQGGQGWNTGSSVSIEKNGKEGESVFFDTEMVDQYLQGQAGESGESGIIHGTGGTVKGDKANYNEVHAAYEKQANNDMNNSDIPDAVRDMIKDYFSQTK